MPDFANEPTESGHETLEIVSTSPGLNKWMFDTIDPFIKGPVLEIGSGIGNLSAYILQKKWKTYLTEPNPVYIKILEKKFRLCDNLESILQLDLVDVDFDTRFGHLFGSMDTVIALNVIEHIRDDKAAINNCYKLLKKNGRLIILVPAYQSLFNSFDQELDHIRRYTRKTLTGLIAPFLRIEHTQYFNFAGIFGWYISGSVQKNKIIPKGQMKLFNYLVPVFRLADKMVFNKAGLSVIAVASKT